MYVKICSEQTTFLTTSLIRLFLVVGSMLQQLCGELQSEPGLLFYAVCPEAEEDSPTRLQHGAALDLWLLRSPDLLQCSELEGLVSDVPLVEAGNFAGW